MTRRSCPPLPRRIPPGWKLADETAITRAVLATSTPGRLSALGVDCFVLSNGNIVAGPNRDAASCQSGVIASTSFAVPSSELCNVELVLTNDGPLPASSPVPPVSPSNMTCVDRGCGGRGECDAVLGKCSCAQTRIFSGDFCDVSTCSTVASHTFNDDDDADDDASSNAVTDTASILAGDLDPQESVTDSYVYTIDQVEDDLAIQINTATDFLAFRTLPGIPGADNQTIFYEEEREEPCSFWSSDTSSFLAATCTMYHETYADNGIFDKGLLLKVRLDGALRFRGLRTVKLFFLVGDGAGSASATNLEMTKRELVGARLARATGGIVPRVLHIAKLLPNAVSGNGGLPTNSSLLGHVLVVENDNRRFLTAHGLDDNGFLYRMHEARFSQDADAELEFDTSGDTGNDGTDLLADTLELVADDSEATTELFADRFMLGNYLNWLAFHVLTGNNDAVLGNFLLYSDNDAKQWALLAAPARRAFAAPAAGPLGSDGCPKDNILDTAVSWTDSYLHARFLAVPAFRSLLRGRLLTLLGSSFSSASLTAIGEDVSAWLRVRGVDVGASATGSELPVLSLTGAAAGGASASLTDFPSTAFAAFERDFLNVQAAPTVIDVVYSLPTIIRFSWTTGGADTASTIFSLRVSDPDTDEVVIDLPCLEGTEIAVVLDNYPQLRTDRTLNVQVEAVDAVWRSKALLRALAGEATRTSGTACPAQMTVSGAPSGPCADACQRCSLVSLECLDPIVPVQPPSPLPSPLPPAGTSPSPSPTPVPRLPGWTNDDKDADGFEDWFSTACLDLDLVDNALTDTDRYFAHLDKDGDVWRDFFATNLTMRTVVIESFPNVTGNTMADVDADTDGFNALGTEAGVRICISGLPTDKVDLEADRVTFCGMGLIRQSGKSTRSAREKSYKIKLDNKDHKWLGNRRSIVLKKHPWDRSRVRSKLAQDLFARLPHSQGFMAEFGVVQIDGSDNGVYELIEDLNDEWLDRHDMLGETGYLYRAVSFTFRPYQIEALRNVSDPLYDRDEFQDYWDIEGKDDTHEPFLRMLTQSVNTSLSSEEFYSTFFDLDNLDEYIAIVSLGMNLDTLSQNYLIAAREDPDARTGEHRWYILPYDWDGAWDWYHMPGGTSYGEFGHWTDSIFHMTDNIFFRNYLVLDGVSERVLARARCLVENEWSPDKIQALIDSYWSILEPHISGVELNSALSKEVMREDMLRFPTLPTERMAKLELYSDILMPSRVTFRDDGGSILVTYTTAFLTADPSHPCTHCIINCPARSPFTHRPSPSSPPAPSVSLPLRRLDRVRDFERRRGRLPLRSLPCGSSRCVRRRLFVLGALHLPEDLAERGRRSR